MRQIAVLLAGSVALCCAGVLLGSLRRPAPAQLADGLQAAASMVIIAATKAAPTPAPAEEVVVAHSGDFWWVGAYGAPHWSTPNCTTNDGRPLGCQYVSAQHAAGNETAAALLARAAGFVRHMCWDPATTPEGLRAVPQVLYGLESATSNPCINKQAADVEMSYRSCAQVFAPYYAHLLHRTSLLEGFYNVPVAGQKRDAVFYANSNCNTPSGRADIMRQLMAELAARNSSLAVHSFGGCDRNRDPAELDTLAAELPAGLRSNKFHMWLAAASKYKFCVVMENSVAPDYVSEKLYQGLSAGCVPIYLGAPNVADYVPAGNAFINYAALKSPAALADELERLAHDSAAYEAKLAWKGTSSSAAFQALVSYSAVHPECRLCAFLAQHRASPASYTLCGRNASYMAQHSPPQP